MWTYNYTCQNELCHHGIKGMKWGVRRFQYKDGSLTGAGRKRYSEADNVKRAYKAEAKAAKAKYKAELKEARNTPEAKAERARKTKKAIKVGAAVAGTALAAYGAYKLNKYV